MSFANDFYEVQRQMEHKGVHYGNVSIASNLKALKLELSDDLLVHLVLISLPTQYSQFKVSYNCQKEKWTLNELISYCVQEEERLKQDKIESAHLASTSKDKGRKRKNNEVLKIVAYILNRVPTKVATKHLMSFGQAESLV